MRQPEGGRVRERHLHRADRSQQGRPSTHMREPGSVIDTVCRYSFQIAAKDGLITRWPAVFYVLFAGALSDRSGNICKSRSSNFFLPCSNTFIIQVWSSVLDLLANRGSRILADSVSHPLDFHMVRNSLKLSFILRIKKMYYSQS